MWQFFNEKGKRVVQQAHKEALRLGHDVIGTEHLLLGILDEVDSLCAALFESHGVSPDDIRVQLESVLEKSHPKDKIIDLPLSQRAKRVLDISMREARSMGVNYVGAEHILLGLLSEGEGLASQILGHMGFNISRLRKEIQAMSHDPAEIQFASVNSSSQFNENSRKNDSSKTPTLNQLCTDLSEMARKGELDPVIGRDKEIARISQILTRRTKNNPVLIGSPGVGKTAVVEGLAREIASGAIPDMLKDKRIVQLNVTNLVAGTKYRGEFEERMRRILKELKDSKNVVLFIDEIHTIIGAGGAEGAVDAANILKPSLARGDIQVIGATTLDEFRKYIEKDSALERRFQPVMVEEPSEDNTVLILHGLRENYEDHHKVKYTEDALVAAAKLSNRYISGRFLPDKAIDLIDEAAARVRLDSMETPEELKEMERRLAALRKEKEDMVVAQEFERAAALRDDERHIIDEMETFRKNWRQQRSIMIPSVTMNDIANVVAEWTGIPVVQMTEAEAQRLCRMEEEIHNRMVGQDEAIGVVSRAIRRARSGMKDSRRPVGSFLFLGPTGVGKTELARSLAEFLFGNEDALLRFDMSEYMERHEVAKLIGAPPGYVGYENGGKMTDMVRRKPFSVILFDEIEKAHPDLFNLLLQILEDGHVTDAQGHKVDFKNTVIIMTSNVGAENLVKGQSLGFGLGSGEGVNADWDRLKSGIMDSVKRLFRPEFLNRVDDIVVFKPLDKDELLRITQFMLKDVVRRAADQEVALSIEEEACQLLLDRGFDPKYGARPLRRTIQRMVEDKLADMLLEGSLSPGDHVSLARTTKDADKSVVKGVDMYELHFNKEPSVAEVK
ncbi:MAG: ATP-dependent Clp protease ATP-binding subunit [Synergistaceae bacterium]|jgi:ATP-dependent Clp protease ATP-binding subunit ClpC|nr:ATP-dependent Clp protease ATP-binding subunit [Synergistaceae bacterium]